MEVGLLLGGIPGRYSFQAACYRINLFHGKDQILKHNAKIKWETTTTNGARNNQRDRIQGNKNHKATENKLIRAAVCRPSPIAVLSWLTGCGFLPSHAVQVAQSGLGKCSMLM
jgi:hypothetical protein